MTGGVGRGGCEHLAGELSKGGMLAVRVEEWGADGLTECGVRLATPC